MRQTIIQNLLGRKKTSDEMEQDLNGVTVKENENGVSSILLKPSESSNEVSASNTEFLASRLNYVKDEDGKQRCVDVDGGLVMAAWETDIMKRTAEMLCKDQEPGFSVLNIGFGLGIIDGFFQTFKPGRHVIVDAHPDAIAYARQIGWEQKSGVELVCEKWEDVISELGDFDVVYWDTYAQEYSGKSTNEGAVIDRS